MHQMISNNFVVISCCSYGFYKSFFFSVTDKKKELPFSSKFQLLKSVADRPWRAYYTMTHPWHPMMRKFQSIKTSPSPTSLAAERWSGHGTSVCQLPSICVSHRPLQMAFRHDFSTQTSCVPPVSAPPRELTSRPISVINTTTKRLISKQRSQGFRIGKIPLPLEGETAPPGLNSATWRMQQQRKRTLALNC